MPSQYQDIHDELRSVARDLLAKEGLANRSLAWSTLADAGWVGLEAPESAGGAGVTFAEVAVILDEMGRAASVSDYLGAAVLGIGTLNSLQPDERRDALLGRVVAGQATIAVALPTDGGRLRPQFRLDGRRLSGRADFVPDAGAAAEILLPAEDLDGTTVIACLPTGTTGLEIISQPVLDETRRLASVSAEGVTLDASAVWRFAGDSEAAMNRLIDRARLAIACDSLGLSEAMLAATVSYAAVRQQFGRPIGSFQAVKHACADMLVDIAVSRQLVGAAVDAVTAANGEASTRTRMAKAHACGTAVDIVGKAMQLHGGIGYTWESGIHVYLKRAALNRALFGAPATHRNQLAKRYL